MPSHRDDPNAGTPAPTAGCTQCDKLQRIIAAQRPLIPACLENLARKTRNRGISMKKKKMEFPDGRI
jgi:hypothetical protein